MSVDTAEEAEKLLTLCCSRGLDGAYYANELAGEQTLDNLERFAQKLEDGYERLKRVRR